MGLGPPVCIPCHRVMDLHDKKTDNYKYFWWCDKCGNSAENTKHLFELNKSEWDSYLNKQG